MVSSIHVKWHDLDQKVITAKMDNGWTWEEMYLAVGRIEALLDSVDYPVCTIFDLTDTEQIPPHALRNLKKLNKSAHPNQGKVAVIGSNLLAESLINIFIRVYDKLAKGADAKLFKTITDAYDFFEIDSLHDNV